MKKIKHFVQTRKILSIIILIAIVLVAYWIYTKSTSTTGQTSYVVSKAKIGNVSTTISGTGQVTAFSQIELKSKVSGDLVYLNSAANGTKITKGTLIAQVDTRDALISLQNAKIAYQKLIKAADQSTLLQSQNSLNSSMVTNAKSYEDGFNTVVTTFTDIPTIMSSLNDMFYSRTGFLQTENIRSNGQTALDLQMKAGITFDKANSEYNTLLSEYKTLSRTDATSTIESFVSKTYLLAKDISEVVKNSQNTIDYVKSQTNDSAAATAAANVSSWSSTINSDVSNLLSIKNTMKSSRDDIAQKRADLEDIIDGTDALDIASGKLNLQQAENTYENYFIRAPFDGVLARLLVKPTDTLSSGTSIGTLVSDQKITTITLNEVDVAKVKVGQKAKLTFDAIDGLTVDGTVTTVDLVGTVSSGVVNYNAEISIDTQDERIKSGMSVNASIVTDLKENVLNVPNSAIKTQTTPKGSISYVEVFDPPLTAVRGTTGTVSLIAPIRKIVEIGLESDTNTEIISGIVEGDQVVTKTILGTTATANIPTTSARTTNTNRSAAGMFSGPAH